MLISFLLAILLLVLSSCPWKLPSLCFTVWCGSVPAHSWITQGHLVWGCWLWLLGFISDVEILLYLSLIAWSILAYSSLFNRQTKSVLLLSSIGNLGLCYFSFLSTMTLINIPRIVCINPRINISESMRCWSRDFYRSALKLKRQG